MGGGEALLGEMGGGLGEGPVEGDAADLNTSIVMLPQGTVVERVLLSKGTSARRTIRGDAAEKLHTCRTNTKPVLDLRDAAGIETLSIHCFHTLWCLIANECNIG